MLKTCLNARFIFLSSLTLAMAGGCSDPHLATLEQIENAIKYGEPDTNPAHMAVVAVNTAMSLCSGTLIAEDLVLTAAHCTAGLRPSLLSIYFGNQNNRTNNIPVSEIHVHPDWHRGYLTGDISVLRMASPAPDGIQPIPHLPTDLRLTPADEGKTIEFSGFGLDENDRTGTKRQVENTVAMVCPGPEHCFLNPGAVSPRAFGYFAGGQAGDGGPCNGDSGGPAFIKRMVQGVEKEFVTGVTSYGDQDCSLFGVSTDVSAYADWIESIGIEEVCDNSQDDNRDGYADCLDHDCVGYPGCTTAIDRAEVATCGARISGDTKGGDIQFENYSCSGWFLNWKGPERAYKLDVPEGTQVQVELQFTPIQVGENQYMGNLDLLLLGGSGQADQCLQKSSKPVQQTDSLSFSMPQGGAYLVVDTRDAYNQFKLLIDCEGVESCDTGIDEDGDGLIDCQDPDCGADPFCIGPEIVCDDNVDNDYDSLVDCDDPDCQQSLQCAGENACTQATPINCGDRLAGSTIGANTLFEFNSCFGNMNPESGPEVAYRVNAPVGATVQAILNPDAQNPESDLDFFLHSAVGDTCNISECLGSSGNQPGQAENIDFTMPSGGAYLVVDTWTADNPSDFEIELICDGGEYCDNETDDDNDGKIDCEDSDCVHARHCVSAPENCANRIDDDQDGFVDCDDPDCSEAPACQPAVEDCSNGVDDDEDSLIDCADVDCANAQECKSDVENCTNGKDDDSDGLVDCTDPDCSGSTDCVEDCSNGVDDDGDALEDCRDVDCVGDPSCDSGSGSGCRVGGSDSSWGPIWLLVGFFFFLTRRTLPKESR